MHFMYIYRTRVNRLKQLHFRDVYTKRNFLLQHFGYGIFQHIKFNGSLSSLRRQLLEHFIIVANYCQPARCMIKISTIIIIIIIIKTTTTTTCLSLSLSLFLPSSFAFIRKLIIYDFITTEYL